MKTNDLAALREQFNNLVHESVNDLITLVKAGHNEAASVLAESVNRRLQKFDDALKGAIKALEDKAQAEATAAACEKLQAQIEATKEPQP
jgi:hypothetical protein